ncbi:MAG: ATPase, partial [Cyanobacteria bacterium J06641_2]
LNAFNWLNQVAANEWVRLFAVDLSRTMESKGKRGILANLLSKEPEFKKLLQDYLESQKP